MAAIRRVLLGFGSPLADTLLGGDFDVTPPDAMVVAPATFNTINKWAAGISDTLALGLLNEALGLGLPVVAVPFPNIALAQHPAFRRSMRELEALGVRLLFDPDAYPLPTPNLGPASRDLFPWQALREEFARLKVQQGH